MALHDDFIPFAFFLFLTYLFSDLLFIFLFLGELLLMLKLPYGIFYAPTRRPGFGMAALMETIEIYIDGGESRLGRRALFFVLYRWGLKNGRKGPSYCFLNGFARLGACGLSLCCSFYLLG